MTTTRRTLSSLAVLALAAGLIAGCGDKDEPSPSAGSEATASAPKEQSDGGGESATSTKPDVPKPDPKDYPGMDEHTDEGAEQAYKYFWTLAIWGLQSGDSAEYNDLYTRDCNLCKKFSDDIASKQKKSTLWTRTEMRPIELKVFGDDKYEKAVVYEFVLGPHDEPVYGNPGKGAVEETGYRAAAGMEWESGSWKVAYMESESYATGK